MATAKTRPTSAASSQVEISQGSSSERPPMLMLESFDKVNMAGTKRRNTSRLVSFNVKFSKQGWASRLGMKLVNCCSSGGVPPPCSSSVKSSVVICWHDSKMTAASGMGKGREESQCLQGRLLLTEKATNCPDAEKDVEWILTIVRLGDLIAGLPVGHDLA